MKKVFFVPNKRHVQVFSKTSLPTNVLSKILQLIQCIMETDNNDVYVRDVVIQMQMVVFKIGVTATNCSFINEVIQVESQLNNSNHS